MAVGAMIFSSRIGLWLIPRVLLPEVLAKPIDDLILDHPDISSSKVSLRFLPSSRSSQCSL